MSSPFPLTPEVYWPPHKRVSRSVQYGCYTDVDEQGRIEALRLRLVEDAGATLQALADPEAQDRRRLGLEVKERRGRYNSFTYPQSGFKLEGDRIRLSAIGKVKVRLHRRVTGAIKRVTVIRDIDQWFVALLVEEDPVVVQSGDGKVGVDMGISNIVALSDGTLIDNPRFFTHSEERIKSLQRRLSRKKKGSSNREKAKLSLAKSWRKVRRQRDDFAHKLSDKLMKENKVIVFEDLKIGNMVKNHNLASAMMDVVWGKLRQLTAYKAERRGERVILVNPSGTSQKCSGCGEAVPKELSERVHDCPKCRLVMDRDVNAARNILKAGLEQARVEAEPLLVQRRRISKFGR